VSEFEEGTKKVFNLGETEVGVFRLGEKFYAWNNICPHQGGPVCQGRLYPRVHENLDENKHSHGRLYDENNINIVCPWHGLEFDVRTGKHPGNEEIALDPLPVQIEGGEIYVIVGE
jgi:nitrite reductase (NADH) small subunit